MAKANSNKQEHIDLWSPEQSWPRPVWFFQGSRSSSWTVSAPLDCRTPLSLQVYFSGSSSLHSVLTALLLQAPWISEKTDWPSPGPLALLSNHCGQGWVRGIRGGKMSHPGPYNVFPESREVLYPKGAGVRADKTAFVFCFEFLFFCHTMQLAWSYNSWPGIVPGDLTEPRVLTSEPPGDSQFPTLPSVFVWLKEGSVVTIILALYFSPSLSDSLTYFIISFFSSWNLLTSTASSLISHLAPMGHS